MVFLGIINNFDWLLLSHNFNWWAIQIPDSVRMGLMEMNVINKIGFHPLLIPDNILWEPHIQTFQQGFGLIVLDEIFNLLYWDSIRPYRNKVRNWVLKKLGVEFGGSNVKQKIKTGKRICNHRRMPKREFKRRT